MSGFIAATPFELAPCTFPRVRAEAGHVIVRLELVSMRDALDRFEVEVVLHKECAERTALDLFDAAKLIQP